MNVYVRELVSALAQAGVDCTTLRPALAGRPARRGRSRARASGSCTSTPGGLDLPKEALPEIVDEFTDGVLDHLGQQGGRRPLHANYWLSGWPATASSTSSTCRSSPPSTRWPG